MKESPVKKIIKYFFVFSLTTIVFLPLIWMFFNSFKTTGEITSSTPTFFPRTITFEHYRNLFTQVNFARYCWNSVFVAVVSTLITLILGSLAAYSVYRSKYPGRKVFFGLFLSVYVFPRVLIMIPLFVILSRLHLIDTLFSLVLLNVSTTAPLCIWSLKAFFTTIPFELEEAAAIDGASRLQALFRIILPITAPGLAALSLNSFLLSWTEYLYASVFIMSTELKTIPVGMALFLEQYFIDWGMLMSSSVIVAVPPILLFAFVGRYYVSGLAAGAVKG